jgi:hypothetical protein
MGVKESLADGTFNNWNHIMRYTAILVMGIKPIAWAEHDCGFQKYPAVALLSLGGSRFAMN